ncbi:MAG: triose-phosphate isomerase [Deltaproteobacteria bacterium]|jgi:triosephosphate isomerase|nr:triose-phosphate isomerase [Deltaproteobacteria bacterium]
MKPIFLANWKMNILPAEVKEFAKNFLSQITPDANYADIGFAAPYTTLAALVDGFRGVKGILTGAQNCHWADNGAFTGEVSAKMLKDVGVNFVIIGHSERRQFFGETDETVAKRSVKALKEGLIAVVCVGETKAEYEAGRTKEIVSRQLKGSLADVTAEMTHALIIAYEPVWAIGTGLTATPEIAQSVHASIRSELTALYNANVAGAIPIIYGGSAKTDNIASLVAQPDINGGLVGGASLKPDTFAQLVQAGRQVYK